MTEQDIAKAIFPAGPYMVYGVTYTPTTLFLKDGRIMAGYFQHTPYSDELKKKNIFTFIEFRNAQGYKATQDKEYVTEVSGDELERVVHPQLMLLTYDHLFKIHPNNTVSPKIPIRIGGATVGPGASFGVGAFINGVSLYEQKNRNVQGYIDNGVFVILKFIA